MSAKILTVIIDDEELATELGAVVEAEVRTVVPLTFQT